MNNKLTIVMYHYVREIKKKNFPRLNVLKIFEFRNQLDYLQKNYNLINFDEFEYCVANKKELPKNSCMLTFDDGYKDHIKYVLPELSKRKLQGFFFPSGKAVEENALMEVDYIHLIIASTLNKNKLIKKLDALCIENGFSENEIKKNWKKFGVATRFDTKEVRYIKGVLQNMQPLNIRHRIQNELFKHFVKLDPKVVAKKLYLSFDDIKVLLNNNMYIGGHGYNHLWMRNEKKNVQKKEIDKTLKFLTKIGAETKNWIMCYPFGSYNSDTISILKRKKCIAGLTIKLGVNKITTKSLFKLTRFDTNDFPK